MSKVIREKMPVTELLAGLAEECGELTQASLKLRRVFTGENPTPVTLDYAMDHLYEEIADVHLYLMQLDLPWNHIKDIADRKEQRWEDRLNGKQ